MYTESLERLIYHFSSLPGIGKKTAQRLAFFVLKQSDESNKAFAEVLAGIKNKTRFCSRCHHIAEQELCAICNDSKRTQSVLCVVADFSDIFALESTHEYHGLYHVLGNLLSPLDGIGPKQLNIETLLNRIHSGQFDEIILALTPNTEGEATLSYLMTILKNNDIKISRIARGVPMGSQLEFIDQATLSNALKGRSFLE